MVLTNGMHFQLGRIDPLKKVEKFLKTRELIGVERMNAISMIDMRYPNGFAVTWKPEADPNWEEVSKAASTI